MMIVCNHGDIYSNRLMQKKHGSIYTRERQGEGVDEQVSFFLSCRDGGKKEGVGGLYKTILSRERDCVCVCVCVG